MLTAFERLVAFRYLRARREEGLISVIAFFSLIGIALGVATLIVVLSVMNGVRGEMIKSIIGLEGHVTLFSNQPGGVAEYDALSKQLLTIPGVKTAVPKVEGQIMASHNGAATGAMVSAYRSDDLATKELLTKRITQGAVSPDGVVIGERMAQKLGLQLGDDITLISPEGRATIAGMVPRVKAYPVTGIFSIGMFVYDNGLILMPFEEAQIYFKLKDSGFGIQDSGNEESSSPNPGRASSIEVMVDDPDQASSLAKRISEQLKAPPNPESRILNPSFRVYDWKSSNSGIFQAVIVQRNVMFLILMLIILVASFNIISSLIMLVREKGRDVAILRTMGASRGSIMRIFFTCGASVGVIGTLLGVALGLLIAFNTENIQLWLESMTGHKLFADELYFLSHLPSKVDMREVVFVVLMALGLSFLATIYPARRAASLDPAEGLRYE